MYGIRKCTARGFLLAAVLLFAVHAARADVVSLPEGLTAIEDQAFAGDVGLRSLVIPDRVVSIGEEAFLDCRNLGWITVPESVTALGSRCFSRCADDLLIRTEADSPAFWYAVENRIDVQADTVYRALLISQMYGSLPALALDGPENDTAAFRQCLARFDDTEYQTTVCTDLTADGIVGAIADVFGEAGDQDVSLLYYSGHGISSRDATRQGALLGADGQDSVTATRLRTALDGIPGRKIVIIDACYSGNMLSANTRSLFSTSAAPSADDFVNSFISAFARRSRSNLAAENYFVLTAAAEDEESYEGLVGGKAMGLFTSCLLSGCGYDCESDVYASFEADANGNGVITLLEAYEHTSREMAPMGQHVQAYPENCRWLGLFRMK